MSKKDSLSSFVDIGRYKKDAVVVQSNQDDAEAAPAAAVPPPQEEIDYEEIEKSFSAAFKEFAVDKGIARLQLEYSRVRNALMRAHQGHRILQDRCRRLTEEAIENSRKIDMSVALAKKTQSSVAKMKTELGSTWRKLDICYMTQDLAYDATHDMQHEVMLLQQVIEDGVSQKAELESALADMRRTNENLSSRLEEKNHEIDEYLSKITELEATGISEFQSRLFHASEHIEELQSEIKLLNNKLVRTADLHSELHQQWTSAVDEIGVKTTEAGFMQENIKQLNAKIAQNKLDKQEQRLQVNKMVKEINSTRLKMAEVKSAWTALEASVGDLNNKIAAQAIELKLQAAEAIKQQETNRSLAKTKEKLHLQLQNLFIEQKQNANVVSELQKELKNANENLNATQLKLTEETKRSEEMKRSIDEITQRMSRMHLDSVELRKNNDEQSALIASTQNDLKRMTSELVSKNESIVKLEKARDNQAKEAAKTTRRMCELSDKLKISDLETRDYKKKEKDTEAKVKRDKELFEMMRNERNDANKDLLQHRDDITELEKRLKLTAHQLDLIKDEMSMKEALSLKEQMIKVQVMKDRDSLKFEVQKLKDKLAGDALIAEDLNIEKDSIQKSLINHAAQLRQLQQQYSKVENERDIIGTQLIRRNDELSLLNEKVTIQQMALNKGTTMYNEREEDVRVLKMEIHQLRQKNTLLQTNCDLMDDMRVELLRVNKDLFESRLRCQKLSDELSTPLNVHRWRYLQGVDPNRFELALKMTNMQKLLISKTEECFEKDMQIKQKEQINEAMKTVVASRPGPEVSKQLMMSKNLIRCKNRQLKSVTSEMNMYKTQLKDFKFDLGRLHHDLENTKDKYFDLKRKEQNRAINQKNAESAALCGSLSTL